MTTSARKDTAAPHARAVASASASPAAAPSPSVLLSTRHHVWRWDDLRPVVPPAILEAPQLEWERVDSRTIGYLYKTFTAQRELPWGPPLALTAVVLSSDARLDPATVHQTVVQLHARWRVLFPTYQLTHFDEWKPTEHLPRYFADHHLLDTEATRVEFLKAYLSAAFHTQAYVRALAVGEQAQYAQWALPPLPPEQERHLRRYRLRVDAAARERRKTATDALTPHFARLRYEAHLRWNQLARLRAEYQKVVASVEAGEQPLPVPFSYDERGLQQRLHFVLWSRRSFGQAHLDQYSRTKRYLLRYGRGPYQPDRDHYFLEFRHAEPLTEVDCPGRPSPTADASSLPPTLARLEGKGTATDTATDRDLLWFGDLLRLDVFGQAAICRRPDIRARKQAYLRAWGYGEALEVGGEERPRLAPEREPSLEPVLSEQGATRGSSGRPSPYHWQHWPRLISPFKTAIAGVLAWPLEYNTFLSEARHHTTGLLFTVEPLFAAATFGLLALDLFTTTGARMHEALQVSLSKDCLHTMVVEGCERLVLRMDPKGAGRGPGTDQVRDPDSTDLAEFWVGEETRRNMAKVRRMLGEHYHLGDTAPLPPVAFTSQSATRHRFPGMRPYLFQYSHRHFSPNALTGCLRFLCHGLVFQTPDEQSIIVTSHLLRHVFATHLRQVEKVPLDIIAELLHQKDLSVTAYYAAPTRQVALAEHLPIIDGFATQVGDFDALTLRSPQELQEQFEAAKRKVGVLNHVPGGQCSCCGSCPIQFECVGCAYLIPDPAYRVDITERRQSAEYWLQRAQVLGLWPEVAKMRGLMQQCDLVLAEMDQIAAYREDEHYAPTLHVEA